MKRWNKKKSNLGFSLIELIVSLTVASIVILAIGTLMSVGTRSYYSASTEIELQKESQIAMNQINDLLIKAKEYEYRSVSVGVETIHALLITGSEKGTLGTTDLYYYAVIFDKNRNQLLFQKISKTALAGQIPAKDRDTWLRDVVASEISISNPTPSLLAKYIEELTIEPSSSVANNKGIAQVTLKLSLGEKNYSTFSSVSFRNK